MTYTITKGNECYIYMNGSLIHKKYINHCQSGITFDVMSYRRGDSLLSVSAK